MSYCGARRFAYNRGIGLVKENLDARKPERAAGLAEADLTPAVSWSYRSLDMRWHEVRDVVALPRQNHTAPVRRSSQGQRMWTGHRQR